MPEISLKAFDQLLDTKLEPINTKLAAIEETVSGHTKTLAEHSAVMENHTTALVNIATDVKTLLSQQAVSNYRLERIEHWAREVGPKVGIKLEL